MHTTTVLGEERYEGPLVRDHGIMKEKVKGVDCCEKTLGKASAVGLWQGACDKWVEVHEQGWLKN